MTRTVDPECQYKNSENATTVSRLFSCEGNLSSGRTKGGSGAVQKPGNSLSNVIQSALKADKAEVARKFSEDVVNLLDEDKKKRAVLALLDIIKNDTVIDSEKKLSFEKYIGTTKEALISQGEFELADFLASIFLYTVAAGVKNTVGKEYVKSITENWINSFANTSIIIYSNELRRNDNNAAVEFDKMSEETDTHLFFKESTEQRVAKSKPSFKTYLKKAKEKYCTIKTLLYSDQPKPFYDFYVCNDIERRILVPSKHGTSYRIATIENVTAKSLMECSRFVILAGTGGLGKSMMMRHLLLNSIENYKEMLTIPVFIPLKDFDENINNFFDYIFSKIMSLCGNITEEQFDYVLENGKCLLLFDGLDEIGSTNARQFER